MTTRGFGSEVIFHPSNQLTTGHHQQMLTAISGTTSSVPMQPSEGDQQLLDLDSLSQRLRALEVLLAPPPQQLASGGATGNESPSEDNSEDIVSTSTLSPQSPSNGRREHHYHSHHHSHHHKSLVSSKDPQHTPGSLSRRVQKIETSFWAAAKERKPSFEEFLQKCKACFSGWDTYLDN